MSRDLSRDCASVSVPAMSNLHAAGWQLRQSIRDRLGDEVGTIRREGGRPVALVYPSPYHVAMSSLGFQTIYRILNGIDGVACERAFLPDDVEAWKRARL